MKKLAQQIRKFYPVMSMLLMAVVVFGGIKPASFWGFHQPKMPKCLR